MAKREETIMNFIVENNLLDSFQSDNFFCIYKCAE